MVVGVSGVMVAFAGIVKGVHVFLQILREGLPMLATVGAGQ